MDLQWIKNFKYILYFMDFTWTKCKVFFTFNEEDVTRVGGSWSRLQWRRKTLRCFQASRPAGRESNRFPDTTSSSISYHALTQL